MEVQAYLAFERYGVEEAVHEKALSTPDSAIHIHSARNVRPVDQLFQGAGTFRLVDRPLVGTALQGLHCAQLGGVALKTLAGQFGLVGLDY